MAMIDSVIRKKKLVRAQRTQDLDAALAACDAGAQALAIAQQAHAVISHYLWQQLDANETLCIQRLTAARAEEARRREQLFGVTEKHRHECQRVSELELQLARVAKDLERLDERRAEQGHELRRQDQSRESQHLDEWVLGMHREREAP